MTDLEKFINNVTKNGVENSVYSTDDEIDTYTILGKLNEILKFMQDHPDMKGTIVKILGEAQDFIDFSSDPQSQLDTLRQKTIGNNDEIINLIVSDRQINDHIAQLIDSVTRLDLNKADALTVKLDSVSEITSLETFRTALYNLRKSPQRSYQLQEAEAKRVLNIIGYPTGLSQDTNILMYVDLPYSEAGGFEIDITAMGRNGKHLYKRTMYSTLNANWQDTGWKNENITANIVKLWEGQAGEINLTSVYKNYDVLLFICQTEVSAMNIIYDVSVNSKYSSATTGNNPDDVNSQIYVMNIENTNGLFKLVKRGYYNKSFQFVPTEWEVGQRYNIRKVYGIKRGEIL